MTQTIYRPAPVNVTVRPSARPATFTRAQRRATRFRPFGTR